MGAIPYAGVHCYPWVRLDEAAMQFFWGMEGSGAGECPANLPANLHEILRGANPSTGKNIAA